MIFLSRSPPSPLYVEFEQGGTDRRLDCAILLKVPPLQLFLDVRAVELSQKFRFVEDFIGLQS